MLNKWRVPLGFFLMAHGAAHWMATSVYWKLSESKDLPYTTAVLAGRLDLGDTGIWLFGLMWLLAGIGTAAAGLTLLTKGCWSKPALLAAALFSLVVCLMVYDRAQVGVVIDIAILLAIVAAPLLLQRDPQIAGAR